MIHQSGQWLLAAKYCGLNYTKTRTHSYTRQDVHKAQTTSPCGLNADDGSYIN